MEYLDYTKTTLDSSVGEHGAIIVDDTLTLVLKENASFHGGLGEEDIYIAHAYNMLDEGEEYRIEWAVLDDWDYEQNNGESDACDWDNPSDIYKI